MKNHEKSYIPWHQLECYLREGQKAFSMLIIGADVRLREFQRPTSTRDQQVIFFPLAPGPDHWRWDIEGVHCSYILGPYSQSYELILSQELMFNGALTIDRFHEIDGRLFQITADGFLPFCLTEKQRAAAA